MTRTNPLKIFLDDIDSPWNIFCDSNYKINFQDEFGINHIWIIENYDEIREQLFAEFMGWA